MSEQGVRVYGLMSLEAQADVVAKSGLDTLMFCPDSWALRHRFVNTQTGEVVRARCGSWSCLYCGPRKVDMWRQLVMAAEPVLFVTLTKVGTTLKEAARVLTTVLQYLRRGSKGRGKAKIGARPSYPIEVFAVLEEHDDFEENGFHWHLLVKGVDFLPQEVVKEALRSATHGRSYIVWVKRVKNSKAVGYVTKYLTKEIMRERRGIVEEKQVVNRLVRHEQGQMVMEEERQTVQRMCKAHRIRYSRGFFPVSTAELRQQLFGEKQEQGQEEEEPQEKQPSAWVLEEREPLVREEEGINDTVHAVVAEKQFRKLGVEPDIEEYETRIQQYERLRRQALLESLQALREGRWLYSRRVIGIWSYQRQRLRLAG